MKEVRQLGMAVIAAVLIGAVTSSTFGFWRGLAVGLGLVVVAVVADLVRRRRSASSFPPFEIEVRPFMWIELRDERPGEVTLVFKAAVTNRQPGQRMALV